MNRKYILALAITTITTLVFVAAHGSASKQPSVFLLKSQGKTIAELRTEPGTSWEIKALSSLAVTVVNETTGAVTASNRVTLKIISGTNSVTVTTDEVEGRP